MRRPPLQISSHVPPSVLVVIFQVYLVGVSRLESEGNPPVLRHGHSPLTLSVALQRVGAERQEVQVFHFLCCVQCVQKKFNEIPTPNAGTGSLEFFTLLRNCAFKIFRKCGFQDGLVCLVGFCGVYSQAAVGRAIKG